MKKHRASSVGIWLGLTLMLGLGIVPAVMMAQEPPIVGVWEGTLDPGARPKQRILVRISRAGDGSLSGTIDYPDQSTSGILITAITYKEPILHFESQSIQGSYDGTVNKEHSEVTGTWKQGGATLNLILKRTP